VLIFLVLIILILIPLDQFIILPEFLWFLENKSLLTYFNEHIDFFVSILPFVGMVLLILTLWRKKK
jgi:hypothetical protein